MRYTGVLLFLFLFTAGVSAQKPDSIEALIAKAQKHINSENIDSGRLYYEKAASLAKKNQKWNDFLGIAIKIGNLLADQRQYEEELAYLTSVKETHDYSISLSNYNGFYELYALAHDQMSLYQQVIPLYEKLIHLKKSQKGEDHPDLINIYGRLGLVYGNIGLMDEAKRCTREALHRAEAQFGENHMLIAKIYNSLGLIYKHTGNLETALTYYTKTKNIVQELAPDNNSTLAVLNNNIAQVHIAMYDYDDAFNYINLAHQLDQREVNPILYSTKGIVLMELGKYQEALISFKKSIAVRAKRTGREHPTQSLPHALTGKAFTKLKQFDSAEHYLAKAIQLDTIGKEPSKDYTIALKAFGELYYDQKDYEQAITMYDYALDFYQNDDLRFTELMPDTKKDVFESYNRKAEIYQEWHEISNSEELLNLSFINYYQAAQSLNLYRHSIYDSQFKTFFAGLHNDIFSGALQTAAELYDLTEDSQYVEHIYEIIEWNKSFNLAEELMSREEIQVAVPDTIVSKLKKLTQLLNYNQRQLNETTDSTLIGNFKERIFSLTAELNALKDYVKVHYPQYYKFKSDTQIATIEELRKHLKDEDIFIEYYKTDDVLYALAISKGDIRFYKLEDILKPREHIASLRSMDPEVFASASHEMYADYLRPVLDNFKGINRLIIIPDKELSNIPFEILISQKEIGPTSFKDMKYLLITHTISYHYSASLFTFFSSKPTVHEQNNVVCYAPAFAKTSNNPLLATRSVSDSMALKVLPNLPMAEHEANQIAALFNGLAKTGDMATELDFKTNAPQNGTIHLASHAIIDQQNPLYSKLIFSPEQDSIEDGLLHTYELYNMEFNADLVSLSACNTGIGKYRSGEGVISLARGFMYAGVPNVMMSLWAVPDRSTSTIMESFYTRLKEGHPKAEALRQAKLDYLSTADDNTAAPYFWGGFVFIGNTETDANESRAYIFAGAGIILLLLGLAFVFFKRRRVNS